jgi:hypothetical protein
LPSEAGPPSRPPTLTAEAGQQRVQDRVAAAPDRDGRGQADGRQASGVKDRVM